jgi:lysophospholipase L1-like esterase
MERARCRSWVFAAGWAGWAVLAAAGARAGEAPAAGGGEEIVVAHFGDSTSACSYLKPEERVDAVLNKLLAARYPKQKVVNLNLARDGEFIRQLLDGGLTLGKETVKPRYAEKILPKVKKMDIAILRYGQNDWKLEQRKDLAPDGYGTEAFRKDYERLIATLRKDYPGVQIVLETGTCFGDDSWTDKLSRRYWDAVRALAAEGKLPLADNHKRWQDELAKEKRPLRNDGHPTLEGVRVNADELCKVFAATWPERLPAAARKP